ncbi:MAG: fluoride efflux transporter CrcB, partial [Bacteroidota bacterium]
HHRMSWLGIFLGGGLGSLVRYAIYKAFEVEGRNFPVGTVVANFLSCLVLGFLVAWFARHTASTSVRLFFMVGFCGGFSTFSTFTNESFQLFEKGAYGLALLNIGGSVLICLFAIYLGLLLARLVS